jgi:hypothetical protein
VSGTKKSAPGKVAKTRTASRSTGAAMSLMAPGGPPVVFLDANIIIPEYLRSIFLELNEAGLLQANWSEGVLAETRRNLIDPEGRFRLDAVRVDRMLKLMRSHFPQALVHGSERLVPQFVGRTDPKDEHVAAGALKRSKAVYGGEPVVLVTSNVTDLPQSAFAGTKVRVARPGRFLAELVSAEPGVPVVVDTMLKRFRKPKTTRVDLLNIMANSDCSEFAEALAAAWGLQPG